MERPHFDIVASGARMKMIRQQRNISVKQVMEYMGFESTQAVYKWEAGKCYPQADNLIALAILYRVSPMELLVEEDVASSSLLDIVLMKIRQSPEEKSSGLLLYREILSENKGNGIYI